MTARTSLYPPPRPPRLVLLLSPPPPRTLLPPLPPQVWDGTAMVDASVWSVQISGVPVNMSEAYPLEGPLRCYRMLHMALDMPFGYLLATIDTQTNALAAAEDDPNRRLPELVYTMFVPLSTPIPDVYDARMVQICVKTRGNKVAHFELPSAGFQDVRTFDNDSGKLHVTIDLQRPLRATKEDLADPEYMAPSAMVDSSDEVIIELSHQPDAQLSQEGYKMKAKKLAAQAQLALAYALRDLVHTHISSKHLSTAYASASETARTGSGDCTEHAVLLAALLKARGIPARVCHGLVYVEQGASASSKASAATSHLFKCKPAASTVSHQAASKRARYRPRGPVRSANCSLFWNWPIGDRRRHLARRFFLTADPMSPDPTSLVKPSRSCAPHTRTKRKMSATGTRTSLAPAPLPAHRCPAARAPPPATYLRLVQRRPARRMWAPAAWRPPGCSGRALAARRRGRKMRPGCARCRPCLSPARYPPGPQPPPTPTRSSIRLSRVDTRQSSRGPDVTQATRGGGIASENTN